MSTEHMVQLDRMNEHDRQKPLLAYYETEVHFVQFVAEIHKEHPEGHDVHV